MKILVLNAGSSSLKYHLFEVSPETIAADSEQVLAQGLVERVSAMADALPSIFDRINGVKIEAVGHRVVHVVAIGLHQSILIDEEVEKGDRRAEHFGAAAQSAQSRRVPGGARASAGRAAGGGVRYRVPSHAAAARLCNTGCRTSI